jgi:hypothetical protein
MSDILQFWNLAEAVTVINLLVIQIQSITIPLDALYFPAGQGVQFSSPS